jgi:ATP-dependent Clp protease ATP-binding subunit ClpC
MTTNLAADHFRKLTPRARQVIVIANQEGERFGHTHIGTEHLLLALVVEGQGVAAQLLKEARVSEQIRQRLEGLLSSESYGSERS